MVGRTQDSRLKTHEPAFQALEKLEQNHSNLAKPNTRAYLLSCAFCLVFCVFFASVLCAQEEDEDKDEIIELPPVKIEIVDTTQLDIPKERFRSFMKPDPRLYAPLSPKERPWYIPSTSVPEKIKELPLEAEENFLFSSTAQAGVPMALMYRMLLIRGFGSSEALLDMGRSTLRSERTADLVSDTSRGLGNFTIDELKGAFTHQTGDTSLKTDIHYDARQMGYLDESGEEYPNDRSLFGLSADWDQRLPGNARSSLSFGISNLKMEGPFSPESENGLDLKIDSGIKVLWPKSNPIDAGLSIEYFHGDVQALEKLEQNDSKEADSESVVQELREAILRLHLRDNYIRLWPFVLGVGVEFMTDARKGSAEGEDWVLDAYLNPCGLLTSQLGTRTVLRFGVERYILGQDLRDFYLDRDYLRLNPGLDLEKTWDLHASLQHRLSRDFTASIGAFDREIRNLTVFEKTSDDILAWKPISWDSARISGSSLECRSSLMNGRIELSLKYVHEFHDRRIPYRPKDKGDLTITCFAPFGLELTLSGQFYGVRYVDVEGNEASNGQDTLSSYFLWNPRVSRAFGKYASVFLAAELYVGQDHYQIWEGYKLPDRIVDFGLTLKL